MSEPNRPDNPNQQLVRADGSGPADEGSGGTTSSAPEPSAKPNTDPPPSEDTTVEAS